MFLYFQSYYSTMMTRQGVIFILRFTTMKYEDCNQTPIFLPSFSRALCFVWASKNRQVSNGA